MDPNIVDAVNTSYWRSNFYIIPDRPPGKDYTPPLLPGPTEDTKRGMTMHIFFVLHFIFKITDTSTGYFGYLTAFDYLIF